MKLSTKAFAILSAPKGATAPKMLLRMPEAANAFVLFVISIVKRLVLKSRKEAKPNKYLHIVKFFLR